MKVEKEHIIVMEEVDSWEKAIRVSSQPLLDSGIISQQYQDQMIENVKTMGPYIVISEDIAIPHARPEDGAKASAISVLKLSKRVSFGEKKKVSVVMSLACSDSNDHVKTLQYIADLLSDSDNYQRLLEAESKQEIYELFNERRINS